MLELSFKTHDKGITLWAKISEGNLLLFTNLSEFDYSLASVSEIPFASELM